MAKSLAQIEAQIQKLQNEAGRLRAKEAVGVIAKIKGAIAHYGLTAEDLGFGTSAQVASKASTRGAAKQAAKPGRKKASGKKSARPAKFADGTGNSWSGMGKRPGWFKAALASGKTPEQLLVKAAS